MINFKLGGVSYQYDDTSLTVKEARVIKKNAGFGLVTWAKGLAEGDPDALVAMVWLSKTRAGEAVRWQDLDDLDLATIEIGSADDEDPPARVSPTLTVSSRRGRTPKAASSTT